MAIEFHPTNPPKNFQVVCLCPAFRGHPTKADAIAAWNTRTPEAPVHILHQGLLLCGFATSTPNIWPEGHTWVSLKEVKGGLSRPPGACSVCWRRVWRVAGVTPPP